MNRFVTSLRASLLALAAAQIPMLFAAPQASAETREFYIVTVHYDGITSPQPSELHGAEPFPDKPFASTNGMWVKGPKPNGEWQVRTFVFDPSQVTVQQGDEVKLVFVGVQGGSHTITVEGVEKPVVVKRGTTQTVTFKADKPGLISYTCTEHPPSMKGQVLVLPRS